MTLRWGILGTAGIAVKKVIPAIQRTDSGEVVAIASRDRERAAAVASSLGIPTSYGSYEDLLAADDVDAVYIPLPNDLHAAWTLAAAEAGKHVLCEKPLAMDTEEAAAVVAGCEDAGVKLAEAFMYRLHPTWEAAVQRVRDGEIGDLQAVQSWFSFHNDDPANIRNRPENGGGAVMDIGCYAINLSRMLFAGEPERVQATVQRDRDLGIDVLASAILDFPGGGQGTFTCSIRAEPDQRVHILGTRGRIDIEIPFNIPPDRETRITLTAGGDPPVAPDTQTLTFPAADAYGIQAERFARAVLDDTEVPVPPSDAVANMRVIDAVLAAG